MSTEHNGRIVIKATEQDGQRTEPDLAVHEEMVGRPLPRLSIRERLRRRFFPNAKDRIESWFNRPSRHVSPEERKRLNAEYKADSDAAWERRKEQGLG